MSSNAISLSGAKVVSPLTNEDSATLFLTYFQLVSATEGVEIVDVQFRPDSQSLHSSYDRLSNTISFEIATGERLFQERQRCDIDVTFSKDNRTGVFSTSVVFHDDSHAEISPRRVLVRENANVWIGKFVLSDLEAPVSQSENGYRAMLLDSNGDLFGTDQMKLKCISPGTGKFICAISFSASPSRPLPELLELKLFRGEQFVARSELVFVKR